MERLAAAILMLWQSTLFVLSLFVMLTQADGGERTRCAPTQIGPGDWHYRTKVDGIESKCWYIGERMRPREQLYWGLPTVPDTPALEIIAPDIIVPEVDNTTSFDQRWKGERQ